MARILVVDDNAMIREVLRLVLESAGHAVEEAEDGDVALQNEVTGFDLIITDLYMPRVSGFDVIRATAAAQVPTMAVSGGDRLSGEDPLVVALELGALLALRKPFSAMQVLQGVAECIGGGERNPRVVEYARG